MKTLILLSFLTCVTSLMSQEKNETKLSETIKERIGKDMQVRFKIFLDDKQLETNSVHVNCINIEYQINSKIDMSSDFTAFLKQSTNYIFLIGHDGYNTKTIDIVTNPPRNEKYILETEVYLYTGKPDDYGGKLIYNQTKGKYILEK